jgi:hypothetical protein
MRIAAILGLAIGMVGWTGCVVADGSDFDDFAGPRTAPQTVGPNIVYAEAEAKSWDDGYWALEAEVEPGNSPIVAVKMEFYDDANCRCFIERIELFPSEWYEGEWELDWYGPHSVLDPWYDHYSVLVTATDAAGHTDEVRIWPDAL